MNDLAEFLLARCDEDERIADIAASGPGCGFGDYELAVTVNPPSGEVKSSPGRVAAECEAKRLVVGQWRQANWATYATIYAPLTVEDEQFDRGAAYGLEVAMQYLALPYSGHPDYMEEWKP